jgi:serine/threonine protein kinase
MKDGLRYLHGKGIIHRDIRLSNLILKHETNDVKVVIIDDEQLSIWARMTLLAMELTTQVVISAGRSNHICPKLQMTFLHASWWSFIYCFQADLMTSTQGTFEWMAMKTLRRQVWKDIESSKIWGQFYGAAGDKDYNNLLDISDVFCHV